jgi:hypothetical protein
MTHLVHNNCTNLTGIKFFYFKAAHKVDVSATYVSIRLNTGPTTCNKQGVDKF